MSARRQTNLDQEVLVGSLLLASFVSRDRVLVRSYADPRFADGRIPVELKLPRGHLFVEEIVPVQFEAPRPGRAIIDMHGRLSDGAMSVLLVPTRETHVDRVLRWLIDSPMPIWLLPADGRLPVDAGPSGDWIAASDSSRIVRYLAPSLFGLPAPVALQIVAVYASPTAPASLKQLAAACEMSERHLRRLLTTTPIRSTHDLFSASRVLRAYRAATDPTQPMAAIAGRYGFGTVRTLRSQWIRVTGESLRRKVGLFLSDAAIIRIARHVCDVAPRPDRSTLHDGRGLLYASKREQSDSISNTATPP